MKLSPSIALGLLACTVTAYPIDETKGGKDKTDLNIDHLTAANKHLDPTGIKRSSEGQTEEGTPQQYGQAKTSAGSVQVSMPEQDQKPAVPASAPPSSCYGQPAQPAPVKPVTPSIQPLQAAQPPAQPPQEMKYAPPAEALHVAPKSPVASKPEMPVPQQQAHVPPPPTGYDASTAPQQHHQSWSSNDFPSDMKIKQRQSLSIAMSSDQEATGAGQMQSQQQQQQQPSAEEAKMDMPTALMKLGYGSSQDSYTAT